MGVVYLTHDPELDWRVAVKLIRPGGSAESIAEATSGSSGRPELDPLATTRDGSGASQPLSDLTQDGDVMGTPAFMAPEVLHSKPADAISDQFGFCVILWRGLFGELPYRETTLPALMVAMRDGPPPLPRCLACLAGCSRWCCAASVPTRPVASARCERCSS